MGIGQLLQYAAKYSEVSGGHVGLRLTLAKNLEPEIICHFNSVNYQCIHVLHLYHRQHGLHNVVKHVTLQLAITEHCTTACVNMSY